MVTGMSNEYGTGKHNSMKPSCPDLRYLPGGTDETAKYLRIVGFWIEV
jgi:hypothetical protein